MHHERPAHEPGGDAAGPGHEAAEADDDDRPVPAHGAQCLGERAHEPERRGEQRGEALAAQATDRKPFDRQPCRGHQPCLDALVRAEPHDPAAARLQFARERERREHVPAGAAGHDHHGAAHVVTVAGPRVRVAASW
ncbi:MAG: hypothetical protein CMLOHMNK_03437 [Steroidobacteraceae bacterium]|nr:hypothetical protein [Steroidobacteraceae bacterium]